ncbi:universal stress protein [Pseudoduganella violaceinigra]|uniref:universal stress protein n=1 Tax=Pseudoduganella violaceinigra TaxID=246602 RepID=UPI0003F6411E|nr:universal stress protein [Pseudoduganella violaceinigra]
MYKTILLHADTSRSAPARLKIAAILAGQQQAHLVCAAMTGISRYAYRQHEPLPHDVMRPDLAQLVTARARQALDEHAKLSAGLDVQSLEQRLVNDDAYGGLVLQSRYADLLIVGQADRDDPATGALQQDLPEYLILNGCCPVLVVPFAGQFPTIGKTIVVAWNGSTQAARAVAGSLPLMASAARVVVAIVDAMVGDDEHGEEPGADIALFLARHGVKVDVMKVASDGDIGETLLATADQAGADLLVMGAYGHPRLREIMLGGATRTILGAATLPVLLSH